jgi:hypothetical protein
MGRAQRLEEHLGMQDAVALTGPVGLALINN